MRLNARLAAADQLRALELLGSHLWMSSNCAQAPQLEGLPHRGAASDAAAA